MQILDQIIRDEFGDEHIVFKQFLEDMLKIDPKVRPSASVCLKHPFFF